MSKTDQQRAFEQRVIDFASLDDAAELENATRRAKAGDAEATFAVAAAIARVGFATPEAAMPVLDCITRAWLDLAPDTLATPEDQRAALAELATPGLVGADFWDRFWDFVDTPGNSGDEVTARVAALGASLHESFRDRAVKVAEAHPGAPDAATRPLPPRLTLDVLAAQPEGSLGHAFYRLIVDNDFNLEVLDREAIGLAEMHPALAYLNTRILQMHDVWHLMGGYRTTALQEVGISAFQLAQFGHSYSGMLIATAAATSAFNSPDAFGLIMQLIAEGWLHGRTTPFFMAIEWENEWHLPIAEIRARHGIRPFESVFPADLIEQLRDAA